MKALQSGLAIGAVLVVAGVVAWAGSAGGVRVAGVPQFALCGALAFALNWLAFVPSFAFQTERYYDLTGSITYWVLIVCAWTLGESPDPRSWLLGGLVGIWALRLGSFLFLRILREGSDRRFEELKPDFARFLLAWTLQGLWAFLTLSCALAAMTAGARVSIGWVAALGLAVWCAGFGIEVAADHQKRKFRSRPENRDRFIDSGLWSWSRHPNYFGEITLWVGIALIALPALSGWQYVTLISPVFVFALITRISGIPPLESRADEKWGSDPAYRAYKAKTPVLFPRPPA